ncbi:MAG: S1C family serine protease [Fidelibacterota bacterium]
MKRMIPAIFTAFLISWLPAQNEAVNVTAYRASLGDSEKVNVTARVKDGVCTVVVDKGGETKTFSFSLDHLDVLDSLTEKLSELKIDVKESPAYLSVRGPKTTWLGVYVQPLTDQLRNSFRVKDPGGVLVSDVVEGSPAEAAGLKAGDVIVSVDRKKMGDSADFVSLIRGKSPGDRVRLRIVRDGRKRTITATLDSRVSTEGKRVMPFFKDLHMDRIPGPPRIGSHPFDLMEGLDSLRNEVKNLRNELENLKKEIREGNSP